MNIDDVMVAVRVLAAIHLGTYARIEVGRLEPTQASVALDAAESELRAAIIAYGDQRVAELPCYHTFNPPTNPCSCQTCAARLRTAEAT